MYNWVPNNNTLSISTMHMTPRKYYGFQSTSKYEGDEAKDGVVIGDYEYGDSVPHDIEEYVTDVGGDFLKQRQ